MNNKTLDQIAADINDILDGAKVEGDVTIIEGGRVAVTIETREDTRTIAGILVMSLYTVDLIITPYPPITTGWTLAVS